MIIKNDINFVEKRGNTIFKSSKDKDFKYELEYLKLYKDNKNVVNLIEYSQNHILIDFVEGELLYNLDYENRVNIFLEIVKNFKYKSSKYNFVKYSQWIDRVLYYDYKKQDFDIDKYLKILKQERNIIRKYPENVVIHGDLHFYNIIGNTIIDPKGVGGNPIMEYSRFIENEVYKSKDNGLKIVNDIIEKIDYPNDDLISFLIIDTIMSMCWFIQDGGDYKNVKHLCDLLI